MIEVCAAAVVRADGRVLVARRVRPEALRGLWEFPGGKLEPGETGSECLVRELQEELGLAAHVGRALDEVTDLGLGDGGLRLTVYAARSTGGTEPRPLDGTHDDVRWVRPEDLPGLELAPLDRPLIAAVRAFLEHPDDHL